MQNLVAQFKYSNRPYSPSIGTEPFTAPTASSGPRVLIVRRTNRFVRNAASRKLASPVSWNNISQQCATWADPVRHTHGAADVQLEKRRPASRTPGSSA